VSNVCSHVLFNIANNKYVTRKLKQTLKILKNNNQIFILKHKNLLEFKTFLKIFVIKNYHLLIYYFNNYHIV